MPRSVIHEAADGLEARLVAAVGAADVEAARRTLACLGTMGIVGA